MKSEKLDLESNLRKEHQKFIQMKNDYQSPSEGRKALIRLNLHFYRDYLKENWIKQTKKQNNFLAGLYSDELRQVNSFLSSIGIITELL